MAQSAGSRQSQPYSRSILSRSNTSGFFGNVDSLMVHAMEAEVCCGTHNRNDEPFCSLRKRQQYT